MPAPIKLLIFDCDGVLVDSEPLAMRVLLRVLAAEGVTIEPEVAFRDFLGRSLGAISQRIAETHGVILGDAALGRMRNELYALYRQELTATIGLVEALDRIDLPICVASSSQVERIELSLALTGLIERFAPHIFSATMVSRGKPAPDLFELAASRMGLAPEDCLVIEDSPAGIAAAKAAGMRVCAFLGGSHVEQSGLRDAIAGLGADAVIEHMDDLPATIARLQGNYADVPLFVAVDVGTGSARAAVVNADGIILGRAESPIAMRRVGATIAEHDSADIWRAACLAVREAVSVSGAPAANVQGIAFDATCSLVVRTAGGAPLAVTPGSEARWDTISWMDHRALGEAAEITTLRHQLVIATGGVVSPEMELPKLLWLKRHAPDTWNAAGRIADLADFLTGKASGSSARSQSTMASKWMFGDGWNTLLAAIGLADLRSKATLPETPSPVGADLGPLTPEAAADLGLPLTCRVATGIVDAHAGALGLLGSFAADPATLHEHICLVAGTSSCLIALSATPRPAKNLWGPYPGAALPGMWLTEAGQSAAGGLLDHVLSLHAAGGEPTIALHRKVEARIGELLSLEGFGLAASLHVLPDFHGNRSPLAEPSALGVISGLALESDFDSLCRLYWRTAVGLALGLRQNLAALAALGYAIGAVHIGGGHVRSRLLAQLYADATGATLVASASKDPILLGTAMIAATAAGAYPSLAAAAQAMAREPGQSFAPNPDARMQFDRDYRILLRMQQQRAELDALRAGTA